MLDIDKFVNGLHEYIGKALAPIVAKQVDIERRIKNQLDSFGAAIKQEVEQAVAALPPAKAGVDGTSVTLEDVAPLIRAAVAQIPIPKDGENGTSVTVGQVLPMLKEWFDALPKPKDGADGKSVTIDDVRLMLQAEQATHLLEIERRANDRIDRCIDRIEKPRDGKDGRDGADGLGFDDFEPIFDGRRTFTLRCSRGDKVKEWSWKMPVVIECGVYVSSKEYEQGDGVTCGGNYWIALKDTSARPGDNNTDWRLAVRKGRDGKDGVDVKPRLSAAR